MKCDHCGEDRQRLAIFPMLVKAQLNEKLLGIKDYVVCKECLTTERHFMYMKRDDGTFTTMRAPEYYDFRIENNPGMMCYECGSTDNPRPSNDVVKYGRKSMPHWMRLAANTDTGLSFKGAALVHRTLVNAMVRALDYDDAWKSGMDVAGIYGWTFYSVEYLPTSDFFNRCQAIPADIALLTPAAAEGEVYLCASCHEKHGRTRCKCCESYTNGGDLCMICKMYKDLLGSNEYCMSFSSLLCDVCTGFEDAEILNNPSWDRDKAAAYMVMSSLNRAAVACSCPQVSKTLGHCLVCGTREARYVDGVTSVCSNCVSSHSQSAMSVDYRENTFGSELEMIADDGDGYYEDDEDDSEVDNNCDCYECRRAREARARAERNGGGSQYETYRAFKRIFELDDTAARSFLRFTTDGSLSQGGVELRVGPLNEKHLDKFKRFVTYCSNNYNVDGSCGGHVHIGAQHLEWYTVRDLFRYAKKWEDTFFSAVPSRRRTNQYCSHIGDNEHIRRALNAKTEFDFVQAMVYNGDRRFVSKSKSPSDPLYVLAYDAGGSRLSRYLWFNASSYYIHRTMEVRLLEGTLNHERLGKWIKFWLDLVNTFKNDSDQAREDALRISPEARLREDGLFSFRTGGY